jgi:hypothetical protein
MWVLVKPQAITVAALISLLLISAVREIVARSIGLGLVHDMG